MTEPIQHDGIVVALTEGVDGIGGKVRVRIVQADACSECRAKSMCMSAESKEKIVDCDATAQQIQTLSVGDKVVVSVSQRMGWKAVTLAYILPFVVLTGVLASLDITLHNEALAGLTALVAVGVYYGILACFKDKISREFSFTISAVH